MSRQFTFKADAADTAALLNEFFDSFSGYDADSRAKISAAWDFLCRKTADAQRDGEPRHLHYLRTAFILAGNALDADCICAALLHGAYLFGSDAAAIEKNFGTAVRRIVDGASKITHLSTNSKTLQEADAIRKMLFAMSDDVRIIFVKLADKLDAIRNIKTLDHAAQRALAQEVIDIWAPLADRLGMSAEKNEFEDLSLKYTNPDAFQQIKAVVSQKQTERASYLSAAERAITNAAAKANLEITVTSRAKHFYSIYQKMRKRGKQADELFDLLALRVLCSENADCYTLIGIVHGLWKPLDGRFKDYIAMPKANGYQSLHTTVMCDGKPLEIQIRTKKMHDIAEHGVASHWLYKKGLTHDLVDVNGLGLFNQLRELKEKNSADDVFYQEFKHELLGDKIFVFTPRGEVKQLPVGATAIDFAYAIHSKIGEQITGAKANGKIIPLSQPLENTQIIEILTNPQAHPTESHLKMAKTARARQKIHAWLSAYMPNFEAKGTERTAHGTREYRQPHQKRKGVLSDVNATGKVRIGNTTNFLVTFAKCCSPVPDVEIIGYVSRGRGVIIHRADCRIFHKIPDVEHRSIAANWADERDGRTG